LQFSDTQLKMPILPPNFFKMEDSWPQILYLENFQT